MPVAIDHKGKMTVTSGPEVRGLQGRTFRRREPQGDPSDVVVVGGAVNVGNADVGPVLELCISSVNFGELIDGEAVATVAADVFAQEYTEMDDAGLALIRAEQVTASIEDTQAAVEAAKNDEIPTWRLYK